MRAMAPPSEERAFAMDDNAVINKILGKYASNCLEGLPMIVCTI
jgi:hypothetical protein